MKQYIDFNKENNKEDLKFKVGDHVRISNYKNLYAKGDTRNWSEEVFVIRIAHCRGHMLLAILMLKKLFQGFVKKNYRKQIKWGIESETQQRETLDWQKKDIIIENALFFRIIYPQQNQHES